MYLQPCGTAIPGWHKQCGLPEKSLELGMKVQQRNNSAKNGMQMCGYPEYHETVTRAVNQTKLNWSVQILYRELLCSEGTIASLLTGE